MITNRLPDRGASSSGWENFSPISTLFGEAAFVAGQRFSVADMIALVTVDSLPGTSQFGRAWFSKALVRRDSEPTRMAAW